jgi:ElaA protein
MAIGRVAIHPSIRRKGWGTPLMQHAINQCRTITPHGGIKISAQLYLKTFYESLGFVQQTEMYLEDEIPHIEMLLT